MKIRHFSYLMAAASILSASASAVSLDGPLSSNATTAQMDVTASVDPVIQILHVEDLSFGQLDLTQNFLDEDDVTATSSFCVYTNAPSFSLEITTARFVAPQFYMSGANNFQDLTYTVEVVKKVFDGSQFINEIVADDVTPGEVLPTVAYSNAGYINNSCDTPTETVDNIEIRAFIDEQEVRSIPADDYSDTLLITARTVAGAFGG